MDNQKFRVAKKSYQGKNLLAISAWVEEKAAGDGMVLSDLIFLEFTENYEVTKKHSLRVTASDLRAMAYAVKDLLKNGETKYRKYTDPKLAGGSGPKNEISMMRHDKGGYYINLTAGETKIGHQFDAFEFIAFADSITLIAEETEKALYYHQRQQRH